MLHEASARVDPDGLTRRWFADDYFDLFLWTCPDSKVQRFQLCYGKPHDERALTWTPEGTTHHRVDDGEGLPTKNLTPILLPDGRVRWTDLKHRFLMSAGDLDPALRHFVAERLAEGGLLSDQPSSNDRIKPLRRVRLPEGERESRRDRWLFLPVLVGGAVAIGALLLVEAKAPPETRALLPIPRCEPHETTPAISKTCIMDPTAIGYLDAVHARLYATWSLPPNVQPNQEVKLTIRLEPSGEVQCWSFPASAQDALAMSVLSAVGQSNPFPAVPSAANCLTEGALSITFRNPSLGP
jgi:hypothetical protein